MADILEFTLRAAVIGAAASAAMDAWSLLLRRRFHVPTLDYALLGRWIGSMPQRRFVHQRIAASPPVAGERLLGWLAHYAIGITFAAVLLAIWGLEWGRSPTIGPALLIGFGTIAAPWFVMQPAMGAGFAGSRSANPRATRLRNLGTHAVYGLGLFAAATALAIVQL